MEWPFFILLPYKKRRFKLYNEAFNAVAMMELISNIEIFMYAIVNDTIKFYNC